MLYITRHGKTDWNLRHKLQGQTDIPLNEEGRKTAEQANKEYRELHLDVCYCSPLIRAKETAEILLRDRNVPILPDARLMEMRLGEYEGLENSYSIPDCPINALFLEPEKYTSSVGGAESFAELYARTGEFLADVIMPQLRQNRDILIVGHAAVNASIVCQIKGLPIGQFWSMEIGQCRLVRLI